MFELLTVYLGEGNKIKVEFNNEVVNEFYTDSDDFFNKVDSHELKKAISNVVRLLLKGDIGRVY